MSATRLAIVFAFVAGLAGAAQAAIAGALGRRVGSVQAAAFGTVIAAVILVLLAITFAPPLVGTFATVALLIAGQLIVGVLIDAYGLLGSPRLPGRPREPPD